VAAVILALSIPVFSGEENDLLYEEDLDAFVLDFSEPTTIATTTDNILSISFLVITIVGLLANTVVFFVIFCGNEIGKFTNNLVFRIRVIRVSYRHMTLNQGLDRKFLFR